MFFLFWEIWIDFKIIIILQIYKINLLKYWERNSFSLSSEGIVLLTFGCLGLDVVGWLGGLTNDAVAVVIMSDPWNTKVYYIRVIFNYFTLVMLGPHNYTYFSSKVQTKQTNTVINNILNLNLLTL